MKFFKVILICLSAAVLGGCKWTFFSRASSAYRIGDVNTVRFTISDAVYLFDSPFKMENPRNCLLDVLELDSSASSVQRESTKPFGTNRYGSTFVDVNLSCGTCPLKFVLSCTDPQGARKVVLEKSLAADSPVQPAPLGPVVPTAAWNEGLKRVDLTFDLAGAVSYRISRRTIPTDRLSLSPLGDWFDATDMTRRSDSNVSQGITYEYLVEARGSVPGVTSEVNETSYVRVAIPLPDVGGGGGGGGGGSDTGSAILTISDGATFSFGSVNVGSTATKIFTVTNTSSTNAASSITGQISSAAFSFRGAGYPGTSGDCPATLAAGLTCSLDVEFAPQSAGAANSSIVLSYNNISAFSATRAISGTGVAAPPPSAPNAPTSLVGFPDVMNAPAVMLTWADNSSNETGFEIERSTTSSSAGFTALVTAAAGSTGYSDATAMASTVYWYRVRAVNAAGPSAYSNVVEVNN